jgi:hypothetical protein
MRQQFNRKLPKEKKDSEKNSDAKPQKSSKKLGFRN